MVRLVQRCLYRMAYCLYRAGLRRLHWTFTEEYYSEISRGYQNPFFSIPVVSSMHEGSHNAMYPFPNSPSKCANFAIHKCRLSRKRRQNTSRLINFQSQIRRAAPIRMIRQHQILVLFRKSCPRYISFTFISYI
jgi:hypothetical protein